MEVKRQDLLDYIKQNQPVNQKQIVEHFGFPDASYVTNRLKYMDRLVKRERVRIGKSTNSFVFLPDFDFDAWLEKNHFDLINSKKTRKNDLQVEKSQVEDPSFQVEKNLQVEEKGTRSFQVEEISQVEKSQVEDPIFQELDIKSLYPPELKFPKNLVEMDTDSQVIYLSNDLVEWIEGIERKKYKNQYLDEYNLKITQLKKELGL